MRRGKDFESGRRKMTNQVILKHLAHLELKLINRDYYKFVMKMKQRYLDIVDKYTEKEIKKNKDGVTDELSDIMPLMMMLTTDEGEYQLSRNIIDAEEIKEFKLERLRKIRDHLSTRSRSSEREEEKNRYVANAKLITKKIIAGVKDKLKNNQTEILDKIRKSVFEIINARDPDRYETRDDRDEKVTQAGILYNVMDIFKNVTEYDKSKTIFGSKRNKRYTSAFSDSDDEEVSVQLKF